MWSERASSQFYSVHSKPQEQACFLKVYINRGNPATGDNVAKIIKEIIAGWSYICLSVTSINVKSRISMIEKKCCSSETYQYLFPLCYSTIYFIVHHYTSEDNCKRAFPPSLLPFLTSSHFITLHALVRKGLAIFLKVDTSLFRVPHPL